MSRPAIVLSPLLILMEVMLLMTEKYNLDPT